MYAFMYLRAREGMISFGIQQNFIQDRLLIVSMYDLSIRHPRYVDR